MKNLIMVMAMVMGLSFVAVPPVTAMSDEEFGEKVRLWLLDNPEVLVEAMQVLESRHAEAAVAQDSDRIETHSNALFNNSADGRIGTGDAVAVEFFDYQCGFCKRQLTAMEEFHAAHPDRQIVLKEFPILGAESEYAARVALATKKIHGNDSYVVLHNALLAHQGKLDVTAILEILTENNFDVTAILEVVEDAAIVDQIANNRALAVLMGIDGTPAFVFKGSISRGLLPLAALEDGTRTE